MKIKKLDEDEWYWRIIFKFRESMNDFIIERKSSKYPEHNYEISINFEEAREFLKFVKEAEKSEKTKQFQENKLLGEGEEK